MEILKIVKDEPVLLWILVLLVMSPRILTTLSSSSKTAREILGPLGAWLAGREHRRRDRVAQAHLVTVQDLEAEIEILKHRLESSRENNRQLSQQLSKLANTHVTDQINDAQEKKCP